MTPNYNLTKLYFAYFGFCRGNVWGKGKT
jgi:hypothetical protein